MPRKKKVEPAAFDYRVSANFNNKDVEVEGNSIEECLELLKDMNPPKTYFAINAKKGKTASSVRLSVVQARRFIYNKVYREILSKRLLLSLK